MAFEMMTAGRPREWCFVVLRDTIGGGGGGGGGGGLLSVKWI